MRIRFPSVVATIVAGVTLACNDAAVDQITAPPLAATPAQPVLNQYPGVWEYEAAGIPTTIGMQITTMPGFEDDWGTFTVLAKVTFQWANYVSASVNTQLVDKTGRVVNTGSKGVLFSRFFLPVSRGDTTLDVSISTFGQKCGLMGRHTYSGHTAQMAVNLNFVQIPLWQQQILLTSGQDMLQQGCEEESTPVCEEEATRLVSAPGVALALSDTEDCEAPAPPPSSGGGTSEMVEVCATVWREYWVYDYATKRSRLIASIPIGVECYYVNMS